MKHRAQRCEGDADLRGVSGLVEMRVGEGRSGRGAGESDINDQSEMIPSDFPFISTSSSPARHIQRPGRGQSQQGGAAGRMESDKPQLPLPPPPCTCPSHRKQKPTSAEPRASARAANQAAG